MYSISICINAIILFVVSLDIEWIPSWADWNRRAFEGLDAAVMQGSNRRIEHATLGIIGNTASTHGREK